MLLPRLLLFLGVSVVVTSSNEVTRDEVISFDAGEVSELAPAAEAFWPGQAISEPDIVELTLSSPWSRLAVVSRARRSPQDDDGDEEAPARGRRRRKGRRRGGRRRGRKGRRKGRRTTTDVTTQWSSTTPMPSTSDWRRYQTTTSATYTVRTTTAAPSTTTEPPPPLPNYNVVPDGTINERPVIGILAQAIPKKLKSLTPDEDSYYINSYIAASYVKLLESAGARVVPIMVDQTDHYYREMCRYLNGLLLPGGEADLDDSGYSHAFKTMWKVATKHEEEHFPILGISLGMEMIASVEGQAPFTNCDADNLAAAVNVAPGSRLFAKAGDQLTSALSSTESTVNFRRRCLAPGAFNSGPLGEQFRSLGTSRDRNGRQFIAGIEHKRLPVFGVQFHPEMPAFEWSRADSMSSIPRSESAIDIAHHIANVFVSEARLSRHRFPSTQLEDDYLIYNYEPEYTGVRGADITACYFFA